MTFAGFAIIFGPAVILFIAALLGAERGMSGVGLVGVALAGTAAWLGYAALVPHTTGGQTAFGAHPRLSDDEAFIWLPIAVWFACAAVAGWRRVAAPFTIGAAAVAGPFALAWWDNAAR